VHHRVGEVAHTAVLLLRHPRELRQGVQ
jgi:hypothetical protein